MLRKGVIYPFINFVRMNVRAETPINERMDIMIKRMIQRLFSSMHTHFYLITFYSYWITLFSRQSFSNSFRKMVTVSLSSVMNIFS